MAGSAFQCNWVYGWTRIVANPKFNKECNCASFVKAFAIKPNVTAHEIYKPEPVISKSWGIFLMSKEWEKAKTFTLLGSFKSKVLLQVYWKIYFMTLPSTNRQSKSCSWCLAWTTSRLSKFCKKKWNILWRNATARIINLQCSNKYDRVFKGKD